MAIQPTRDVPTTHQRRVSEDEQDATFKEWGFFSLRAKIHFPRNASFASYEHLKVLVLYLSANTQEMRISLNSGQN
jgi:hypothetical protein